MKYQIECNTTRGPITVVLEERSAELAAHSAIEILAAEHMEIAPDEVVNVLKLDAVNVWELAPREETLGQEERERVDWLTNALLRPSDETRYFTIAGNYEGTRERYGTGVWARDQHEAMLLAVKQCHEDNSGYGDPMSVLGIMEGEHKMLDCQYGMEEYADRCDGLIKRPEPNVLLDDSTDESVAAAPREPFTVFSTSGTFEIFAADAHAAEHRVVADRIAGVVAGHVPNLMADIKHWVYRWAYDEQKNALKKTALLFDLN